MRIVAGIHGGRRLVAPRGQATRPTADRVREALFSILFDVSGARVLDLYAGTGAVGIEALSRGAASATFVEHARPALDALRRNLRDLGITTATVETDDVLRVLPRLVASGRRFDLVFADPPYDLAADVLPRVLIHVAQLLAPDGRIVLELPKSLSAPPPAEGLELTDERRYGEAALAFYVPAT